MKATSQDRTIDLAISLALALIILTTIYCYWVALFFGPINFDSGYYLPLSSKFAEGSIPFVDVPMRYTPLGIYFFTFIEKAFGRSPDYSYYQLLLLFFQVCNVILLYKISHFLKANTKVKLFFCTAVLLFQYRWMPLFIELEPFYLFFSLLAILTALTNPSRAFYCFLAGVLCGFSFLSKQYGLSCLLPIAILIFVSSELLIRRVKLFSIAVLGVAVPVLISWWIILSLGATNNSLLYQLSGHGYFAHFQNLFLISYVLISHYPSLILLPWVLTYGIDNIKTKSLVPFWLLASVSPFVLKAYYHYFIPIVPVICLLNIQIFSFCYNNLQDQNFTSRISKAVSILGCVLVVGLVFGEGWYCYRYADWMISTNPRKLQLSNSNKIAKVFPRGTTVLCIADQSIFYLGDYEPPNGPFGGFVGDASHGRFASLLNLTSQVIEDRSLDKEYYMEQPYLRRSVRRRIIRHAGFRPIATIDSRYSLWQRVSK